MFDMAEKRKIFLLSTLLLSVGVAYYIHVRGLSRYFMQNNSPAPLPDSRVVINQQAAEVFILHDKNGDGKLSLTEFNSAYHAIVDKHALLFSKYQQISTPKDWILGKEKNEVLLTVQASMTPLQFNSTKSIHTLQGNGIEMHGLRIWNKVNVKITDIPVELLFSTFMPNVMTVGHTWNFLPVRRDSGDSIRISRRYFPKEPVGDTERLFFRLLSMFHERPFLRTHFPPSGGVAIVQSVSKTHVSVVFRVHAEFQLNTPPRMPCWFTPACFLGQVVFSLQQPAVEHFSMHVPNKHQLNVDMEWLTKMSSDEREGDESDVDIGCINEMRLFSSEETTQNLLWDEEILLNDAYSHLEKQFYPFKQVTYYNFTDVFALAREREKLIHHVVLWGALDDQSC